MSNGGGGGAEVPWTPQSIAKVCRALRLYALPLYALPLYALQAATPKKAYRLTAVSEVVTREVSGERPS
jgi:hypothetical protein